MSGFNDLQTSFAEARLVELLTTNAAFGRWSSTSISYLLQDSRERGTRQSYE